MIPNSDPNLRLEIVTRDAEGRGVIVRPRIIAWDVDTLAPLVISDRGDLVRASSVGIVRALAGGTP